MDPTAGGKEFFPIGTRAELAALELDPSNVASCSPQSGNSMGCPWYDECLKGNSVFRAIVNGHQPKNHSKPLIGPEQIAVYRQLNRNDGGGMAMLEMPCFRYYYSGLHERRKQMSETGEVVKIMGVAGDGKKFRFQETVKAHRKKDPNCDDCMNHKCIKTEVRWVEREIEPMKRPAERYRGHAVGLEIRSAALEDMERESDIAALEGQGDPEAAAS